MAVFFYLVLVIAGLRNFGVNGRAVNISNTWFLPQEGFPVFYRYFSDKVTWNEAEAVCGFHHSDLLSVQTSSQMDTARAYLKEIDVTDNVWIGLRKESPEKSFSWTNGEKLLGDGYWMEPIPKTNEKLCAAIDPVSDFRWNSFYCRGPQVASFVCELPVPEWAKKEDGCMITSLPSLTVTLMPEMGVVQLFSDCGLDGTRRIACKGGVNREEIIRRLSCDVDAFASTIFSKSTTDTIKELNTHQSTWISESDVTNRHETTQPLKNWQTYTPLTRHRRDSDLASLAKAFSQAQEETQTPLLSTAKPEQTSKPETTKSEIPNLPSHVFPHSPYSASERNAPSTRKTESPQATPGSVVTSERPEVFSTAPVPTTKPSDVSAAEPTHKPAKPPLIFKDSNSTTEGSSDSKKGLPVLIITGEKLNDSAMTPSSASSTSENPQIVFMIGNKEEASEKYLVPLADDIIINNPSLSPVEVLNVDLVEVDNITAKTSTTVKSAQETRESDIPPSQATPPQKPESVHPLKLGERKANGSYGQTTSTSTASIPTTRKLEETSPTPTDYKQETLNIVEREDKEGLEISQRPNRGRLLTHSSHPSFYPYFLNRVLG